MHMSADTESTEQDKLKQLEALLQLVERTAAIGVWSLELDTGTLTWSDQLARIHDAQPGFAPAPDDPYNLYAAEWRGTIATLVRTCAQEGTPFDEEMQIVTLEGRRAWVRTIGHAVRSEEGRIVRVEGAVQEIAPHGHRLGTLSRHTVSMGGAMGSGEAFATVDRNGRFTYANEQAQQLVSHTGQQLLGRQIWSVFQRTVRFRLEEQFRRGLAAGEIVEVEELDASLSRRRRRAATPSARAWRCICET